MAKLFRLTLPVWGATISASVRPSPVKISIHAPRVGSDGSTVTSYEIVGISIHAPRVGSDLQAQLSEVIVQISIHAPRVGSDFPCLLYIW